MRKYSKRSAGTAACLNWISGICRLPARTQMPGQLLLHAILYRNAFKEGLRAPRSGRDRMENANAKWSWPQHHYS